MKALVAEDDAKIASFIAKGLTQSGWVVDVARDGEEACAMAESAAFDVGVFDVMLPRLDGVGAVERLRRKGNRLPVIFLSARGSVEDRVRGLRAGGDDYLVKPFSFSELLARMEALVRRARPAMEATLVRAGDVSLDLATREVKRGGERVELQPREFALLEYFLRNPNRPLTKTMILERVWNFGFDPQTNVVDVLVHRLRSKIDPDRKRLQTQRGVGYVFRPVQGEEVGSEDGNGDAGK